jgi:zinc transporter ZupT
LWKFSKWAKWPKTNQSSNSNKNNMKEKKYENNNNNDIANVNKDSDDDNNNNIEEITASTSSTTTTTNNNNNTNSNYILYIDIGIIVIFLITIVTIATVYSMKANKVDSTTVQIIHVWAYSWMTAVCTGLGALPFFMIDDVNDFWLGTCNALAGGMMIAASFILIYEGAWDGINSSSDSVNIHGDLRMTIFKLLLGFLFGIGFIRFCRKRLEQYEDLKMGNIDGLEAQKVLLVVGVMTIHSLSEGVGIGVAFSGRAGLRLGSIVSSSLAVHNIPEGLAVALVLVPKGISAKGAVVWSIFSSIPQPVMAVPTYLFVASFLHVLPIGLGFAAGAMIDVASMELLPEALEKINNLWLTITVTMVSSVLMLCSQLFLSG